MRKLFTVLVGVLLGVGNAPADTIIRDYQAPLHDRFYEGDDKAFIGDRYSFSGVGRSSDDRWATLVSDSFFISANHYPPAVGATVTFWEANLSSGPTSTYTVAGGQQIGSTDLWVGWFDTAVSPDFTRYAVLELALPADYLGQILFNYGVHHRVGRNVSDQLTLASEEGSTGWTMWFDYDNNDMPSVGGDETFLQSGDSGAPTFIIWNGQLTLAGIHWSISTDGGVTNSMDTFVPAYINEINAVLATQSESLSLVPEPGSGVLVLLGGVIVVWVVRRKKFACVPGGFQQNAAPQRS